MEEFLKDVRGKPLPTNVLYCIVCFLCVVVLVVPFLLSDALPRLLLA